MNQGDLWKTLDDAIKEVEAGKPKGITCPCCKQYAKIYNRKLNSAMAYSLILVVKHFKYNPEQEWVHVERLLSKKTRATDFYKLRFWDLIEEGEQSGHWKVLPKGIEFASNKITVPKKVAIYNNEFLDDSEEQTTIIESLGEHFDFYELMSTPLD
jgi:hypothetical protein